MYGKIYNYVSNPICDGIWHKNKYIKLGVEPKYLYFLSTSILEWLDSDPHTIYIRTGRLNIPNNYQIIEMRNNGVILDVW